MSKRERGPNGRLERVDKRAKLVLGPELSKSRFAERKALLIDTTTEHQNFEYVVHFIAPWLTFFELLCVLSCLLLNRRGFNMVRSFTYWYQNVLGDKETLESIPWQIKVLPRPQVIASLCEYFKSLLRKLKSKLSKDKQCYWPCIKCLSRPPDFHNEEADNQAAFHLCLRCVKQHLPWAIVSVHQMYTVYPLSRLTLKSFKNEYARYYFKLTTSRKLRILNKKGGYITTEDAHVTWKAIQDGVPFFVDNYIRYFESHLHAKDRLKFKENLGDDAARCAAFIAAQNVQFLAST